MRIWLSGPRILGGLLRPGVSFDASGVGQRVATGAGSGPGQFVYVIQGDHGAVKIGISVNPAARRADLQTGSPHNLFLAFQIWGGERAFDVEQEAHAILDAHRLPGEWFAVSKEMAVASIYGAASRLGCSLDGAPMRKAPIFSASDIPGTILFILGATALATYVWRWLTGD